MSSENVSDLKWRYVETPSYPVREHSRFNPRYWSVKKWIFILGGSLVAIVVIIIGVYFGMRANAYPNYNRLNYVLQDTYSGRNFFNNFDYFTGYDPAQGFVHYVDREGSMAQNLTLTTPTTAVLRVDTTELNATTGRRSVRITSKKQYNGGLFLFDIVHSPYGCATWPAIWLSDPNNWPMNGEIDVIESVNMANKGNLMSLHTTKGCKMDRKRLMTGDIKKTDCFNETNNNQGCGVKAEKDTSGRRFNEDGGGIYAVEWRSAGIRMWFFERGRIPTDVLVGSSPDPSQWGNALADFPNTNCDINSHFRNASIIANIDLCGQLAGDQETFSKGDMCPGSCTDFVANNATAFQTAFWEINSFKVYQPMG